MFDLFRKIKIYGFSKSLRFIIDELHKILWMRPVRHSYSQQGEDIIIDSLLGNKKNGFYVDIGAHDPVRFSNTKRFYDRGWSGINIEPNPLLMGQFKKTRGRDRNLSLGIGKRSGSLTFYDFFPTTLSTFSSIESKKYLKEGFELMGKKKVPVKTLKFILAKYYNDKKIDFLSVDTEGTDLEVLESNNWGKNKPTVICVEINKDSKIAGFLKKQGYQLKISNGINSIFSVS